MNSHENFKPNWAPTLLQEEVVAEGTWWYQDIEPYSAQLIRQTYDYGSWDLHELENILEIPNIDYIDYNISDEGVLYFWKFSDDKQSKTFGSYFLARDHLQTFDGRTDIKWFSSPKNGHS